MLYVGLDMHKEKAYGTVMDEKGNIVKKGRFGNNKDDFIQFFQGIENASVQLKH